MTLTSNEKIAHNIVNIGLHVVVLFLFLTLFFFIYISRKEKDGISNELSSVIQDSSTGILDTLVSSDVAGYIDWNILYSVAGQLKQKNIQNDPSTDENNKKLINKSIILNIILFVLLIILILYFTLYKNYDIHLCDIIIENFLIFIFVGVVEYIFFTRVALKYSSVTSSDMAINIIDRMKYQISNKI
jgi:hypothetical protein